MMNLRNAPVSVRLPHEPSRLGKMKKHPLFGYVILCAVLLIFQILYMNTDFITLTVSRALNLTMIYTIASMGLGILMMMGGLISMSSGVFIGLGAFICGNLLKLLNLPFVCYLLIVIVAGVLLGLGVGIISLRASGINLLILTLALSYILYTLYLLPNPFTGGSSGLINVPYPKLLGFFQTNRDTMYFVVLTVMFLLIVVTMNVINSPSGRALLAMMRSESLAKAMGISILKYRLFAFTISTVYAMIAGALYIASLTSGNATTFTASLGMNLMVAVILGGTAYPAGVFIGCLVYFALNMAVLSNIEFFARNSTAATFLMGILIIVIVMKYPGGLMWFLNSIKSKISTFIYKRRMKKYGPDEN